MKKTEISVRRLVEFILRSGDIDNRTYSNYPDAMLQGARIHRKIQGSQGTDYSPEVPLSINIDCGSFELELSGRADGIINNDSYIIIDEIKGTYSDIEKIEEPVPVHLAQAKCYAYIYAKNNGLDEIGVRMTYCSLRDDNIRYFKYDLKFDDLSEWFDDLIVRYRKWAEFQIEWFDLRNRSVHQTIFPYEYRKGQKELAGYVYKTIYHGKRLFLEAPTGVGKTLAVLFPSVKALGEEKAERIFYLTAKNAGATVANDTYDILRKQGLRFKTINIIAKEKLCPLEKPECNPEACPYARGHYDRINDAVFGLLKEYDDLNTGLLKRKAEESRVCPFEMALDASLFCDGITCDYNYVFDPDASLKRFFAEGNSGEYIFLIDESHNLIDRGRQMYSAAIVKKDVAKVKKIARQFSKSLSDRLTGINRHLLRLEKETEGDYTLFGEGDIAGLIMAAERFAGEYEDETREKNINDEDVLQFYFDIRSFLDAAGRLNEKYSIYGGYTEEDGEGSFMLRLFNTDPSDNLLRCMEKARGVILFSATLLPVGYYMDLISGNREDYAVYAHSVFDPKKLGVFIVRDVSTRYKRRSDSEYEKTAGRIRDIISLHKGNYLVFFPSYKYMEEVCSYFALLKDEDTEMLIQGRSMTEDERLQFIERFDEGGRDTGFSPDMILADIEIEEDRKTLVGFCVLGGVFSEGIDLTEESLIGALIVGTGLPMVCTEREILRHHFDSIGMNGFDYAYKIPGMNKVLQAAGRVIRTEKDTGIVVLMDERFTYPDQKRMFPDEWADVKTIYNGETKEVEQFWKRWENDNQSAQT